jgi:hypothetical protein
MIEVFDCSPTSTCEDRPDRCAQFGEQRRSERVIVRSVDHRATVLERDRPRPVTSAGRVTSGT